MMMVCCLPPQEFNGQMNHNISLGWLLVSLPFVFDDGGLDPAAAPDAHSFGVLESPHPENPLVIRNPLALC